MVAGQFCLVHLFSVLARFLGLVRNLMVQVGLKVVQSFKERFGLTVEPALLLSLYQ